MLQIEELWVCCIPQDANRQYEGFLAKSVVVKGDLKWFRMWKCFSQQFHSNSNENSYVQAGGPLHSLRCKKPIKFLASCVTFLGGVKRSQKMKIYSHKKDVWTFGAQWVRWIPPNVPTANQWFFWPGVYCATFWEVQPCCNIDWRCKKLYFWKSFQSVDVLDKVKTGYQIICWKFWLWSVKEKKDKTSGPSQ